MSNISSQKLQDVCKKYSYHVNWLKCMCWKNNFLTYCCPWCRGVWKEYLEKCVSIDTIVKLKVKLKFCWIYQHRNNEPDKLLSKVLLQTDNAMSVKHLCSYKSKVKAMTADCQALRCSTTKGEGMRDGIKSEGWYLPTGRAGDTTMEEWIHTIHTRHKNINTRREKRNGTNKQEQNKRKKKSKSERMTCCALVNTFSSQGKITENIQ